MPICPSRYSTFSSGDPLESALTLVEAHDCAPDEAIGEDLQDVRNRAMAGNESIVAASKNRGDVADCTPPAATIDKHDAELVLRISAQKPYVLAGEDGRLSC